MNAPVKDSSSSTSTSLALTWTALTLDSETGGSAIISYMLESYDSGTTTWIPL